MDDKRLIFQNPHESVKAERAQKSKRGMAAALEHVCKNWFPINPDVLEKIQQKINSGKYVKNLGELLKDIKTDFSLYLYCLRQLKDMAHEEELQLAPHQLILNCEFERLRSILSVTEDQISMHRFNPETKPQSLGIRQALISASAAETLAQKTKLDSELAYLCASARQGGLSLVAWNYPRIFAKAITAAGESEEDLDQTLFKVLGFSPLQLGLKAVLDWNQCPDVRMASGLDPLPEERESLALKEKDDANSWEAGKLRHFCEIGETLAKVNEPECFPSSVKKWEEVSNEVARYLGPKGLEHISNRIQLNSALYKKAEPTLFTISFAPEKSIKQLNKITNNKLFKKNTYIKKCPEKIQELFRQTYEAIVGSNPSSVAVKILVSEVIPRLGFLRGCVYLVDANKVLAIPMLRIGNAPLSRYRTLNYSDDRNQSHPVVVALSYSAPIIQEGLLLNGEQISHITGVFGSREKAGVLYLEVSEALSRDPNQTKLLSYFKAVKQCLNDCLGLK